MSDARFQGAKVALFLGRDLVVIKRDDRPDLPFPGYWDLPGGGREGAEDAFACAAREVREELGLKLCAADVLWQRAFWAGTVKNWFLVAQLPGAAQGQIVFGNEGQGWRMMAAAEYIAHPKGVPQFQERLRIALAELDLDVSQESPPLP